MTDRIGFQSAGAVRKNMPQNAAAKSNTQIDAQLALEAAAPDMLRALKITFAALQVGAVGKAFRDMHPATWREIEAAIEMAEGR